MLSKAMEEALNEQMNAEMYSAYLYLSMAAHFDAENLGGFAGWMKAQAQEEMAHAMKFYGYINEAGGKAVMAAIDAPPGEWESPLAVFENVYEHEQKVTSLINDLVDMASDQNDHATAAFLQWFVTEQVEEEASAEEIVRKLEMIGDSAQGLFMMDSHLGQRQAGGSEGE
ncbi:MAG: ferritin [Candidatus Brocadiia bacterium]